MRILLLALWPSLVFAQAAPVIPGCKSSDAIHDAIAAAKPSSDSMHLSYLEAGKEEIARLKALLDKYPDDFFVEKEYVEVARDDWRGYDEFVKHYKNHLGQNPNDPVAQFFYAEALMGRKTPETIKILDKLAVEQPKFALTFATLAEIYQSPAFRDESKLELNSRAYVGLCRENPDAYRHLDKLPNSSFLQESAARLRVLITGRTDDPALSVWPSLWNMEFKVTPLAGHPRVRAQVEQDLVALKRLNLKNHLLFAQTLHEGYMITGNKEGQEETEKTMNGSESGVMKAVAAMNEWSKKNPMPKPEDGEEKKRVYYEARLAANDEWIKLSDGASLFLLDCARSLAKLPNHPDSEFLAAADKCLELEKSGKFQIISSGTVSLSIASLYADRGARLDQVPDLVRVGLVRAEEKSKEFGNDLIAPRYQDREATFLWQQRNSAWKTLLDAYLKLKQFDKARDAILEMESGLGEQKAEIAAWQKKFEGPVKDKSGDLGQTMMQAASRNIVVVEGQYYESLAKLAAAENRRLDALEFYQAAVRSVKGSQFKFWEYEWTSKAQALWKELGGTSEGWQNWLAQASAAAAPSTAAASGGTTTADQWTKMERALPDFEVTDIAGKTWKKTSFAGKTAFINLWATWCGPCREELPQLQKLYDRVKDRTDVAVITINMDDSAGPIEPFMMENKFTFPVLLAKDVMETYLGSWGIPQNWVVDRSGKIRATQIGFGGTDNEDWIKKMIEEIDLVRSRF